MDEVENYSPIQRENVLYLQFCIECRCCFRGRSYLANAEGGRVSHPCLQKEADEVFGKRY